MDRQDFMDIVYSELASDPDNNRANRIIWAADGYAERRVNDALKVIKEQQSVKLGTNLAEVDTDCISRKSAIERATKEHDFFRGAVTVSDKARRDELLNVMCWLGELPPAQPQRTGKWIRNGWAITCSECGYDMPYTVRNFCPNCGAKMMPSNAK